MAEQHGSRSGAAPGAPATRPRVALLGRAGTGKSAVAQVLFGEVSAPNASQLYQKPGIAVTVADLPGWTSGTDDEVARLVAQMQGAGTPYDLVWYALDASAARLTAHETQLIGRLAGDLPVIIVLTRSDIVTPEALQRMYEAVADAHIPHYVTTVAVAADPLPSLGIKPYGLDDAVTLTLQALAHPQERLSPRVAPPALSRTAGNTPTARRVPTPVGGARPPAVVAKNARVTDDQIVLVATVILGGIVLFAQILRWRRRLAKSRSPAKLVTKTGGPQPKRARL